MKVTTIHGTEIDLRPGLVLDGAMLRDLNLDGVDLSGSHITNSFFNESSLVGADLSNSDLRGSVFFRANLSGADLQGSSLDGCYMKEVIYSPGTVWPVQFNSSSIAAREDDDSHMRFVLRDTSLCSPRWTPKRELAAVIVPPESIVPHGLTGVVSGAMNEQLIANLALNIHRAFLSGDLYSNNNVFGLFDEELLYSWLEDDADDLMYTMCVLMLLSLGLRFDEIAPDGHMRVTFRPPPDMRAFARGPAMRLFRLVFDTLSGVEVELDSETPVLLQTEPETSLLGCFLQIPGKHLDVSRVLDPNPSVSFSPGALAWRPAIDKLIESLLDFLYFAQFSTMTDEVDDGHGLLTDEDWHSDDEELTWQCHLAVLVLSLLNIQEAEVRTNGDITAVLSPPMDVRDIVVALDMDCGDGGVNAVGNPTETELLLRDCIARPSLGIFGRLFD